MGQRTHRRVPLDFDWPIGEVWKGYLLPDEMELPACTACDGEGYGPEARAVAHTFYAHEVRGPWADALCWHDKLGQAEVDNLIEQGRLRVWRDGEWRKEPRSAAEVNAAQHGRGLGLDGHDAINRMILIRFRCERLGIAVECPVCGGHGTIGTEAQREAADNWSSTDPPTGDGWQLWETTSEGSPVSPVFATAEELADWCGSNATVFGSSRATSAEWLRWFLADEVDIASTMMFTVPRR